MYAKFALRNAKRSAKDYLIYIVTMTICVMLFYSFLSITSSYYDPDVGSEYDLSMLSGGVKAAVCTVTLLLLFLIRFVNRYMLLRKQREFAVCAVMGMEQRTIGRLFFAETSVMGLISIGIGIFSGAFCSQFMTAMLQTFYGRTYQPSWMLFPDTVFLTAGFFLLSFAAVGMSNARAIRKTKIVGMLSAEKENDPALKESRWIRIAAVLFELAAAWMAAAGVQKLLFYYDVRFPFRLQLMVWGNLVFPAMTLLLPAWWLLKKKRGGFTGLLTGLFVCSGLDVLTAVSVPRLAEKYYLGSGMINQYMMFVVIDLIFFICALIFLAGSFLTVWKEKSPKYRYSGENLFFFGQVISKLDTAGKTMTVVCITLVCAILLFVAAPVLTGWSLGYLEMRSVYDIQIFSRYNDVEDEENVPQDGYGIVTDFLKERKLETAYDCTFSVYLPEREEFHSRVKYEFPVAAVSLSDYNAIREMLGYAPVFLEENEFTTQWEMVVEEETRDRFLAEHERVVTDGGTLKLSAQPYHNEGMGETIYNSYTDVLYVFPDAVCEKLMPVMRHRYIRTAETMEFEDALALNRLFAAQYPEKTENGASYFIRLSTLQINETKAYNFILQTAMLYGAVVLMVICLTVLALQQLLDAGQYRYRFEVLRKLGVEEERIGRLITKQLCVWFGIPVTAAVGVAATVLGYFLQTISAEIATYVGTGALLGQIAVTAGILTALLVCYFLSTWVLFKRTTEP